MKTQKDTSEKVTSLQKAIAFKSSRPFFKVVIQPSCIYGNHLVSFLRKIAIIIPFLLNSVCIQEIKCLSNNKAEL